MGVPSCGSFKLFALYLRYSTLWIVATIYLFGFIYAFHDLAGGGVCTLHLDLVLLFCYIRDNAGAAQLFAAPRVGRFFSGTPLEALIAYPHTINLSEGIFNH